MSDFIVVECDELEARVIKALSIEKVKVVVVIINFDIITERTTNALYLHLFQEELPETDCFEDSWWKQFDLGFLLLTALDR